MTGSSNFKQFDPAFTDAVSDSSYNSSSQLANGFSSGIMPSAVLNKFCIQQSTMTAAIGTVLANLGYTVSDASMSGLVTALTTAFSGYPIGFHGSARPVWGSSSTITISSIHERDSTNAANIDQTSTSTLSTASVGLNGLDAGTIANNTFYYLYVVTNGTTTGLMASTVNESASGSISSANYAYTYKRQLPLWLKTDGSANIYPFVVEGWGKNPTIRYELDMDYIAGTPSVPTFNTGSTNVLSAGTATSFTAIDCSSWFPPICNGKATFKAMTSVGGIINIRADGSSSSHSAQIGLSGTSANVYGTGYVSCTLGSNQKIDYTYTPNNGGSAYLCCLSAEVNSVL